MKDCNCNNPTPGFIPVPAKPAGSCRPKACEYTKVYYLPANLGTDAPDQPYAPKPGAYYDDYVVYEANGAIYYYDAMGVPLHIAGGGVTSINGEVGDIVLGTIKILMNGELQGAYNGDQSVEIDLPIPVLGEIATGNTGYINGDMIHDLQAKLLLALATETGAREEGDEALSQGLQVEANARKQADEALRALISNQFSELDEALKAETAAREADRDNLQTNINNVLNKEMTDVNNLQTNINTNANAIQDLKSSTGTQLDELEARVNESISDLATQEANDVSELDARVTNNANGISNLDTRLMTAEGDLTTLETEVSTLQSDFSNLTDTVTANNENLNQAVQRDTTVTSNDSTVVLTKTTGNIKDNTSTSADVAFPVADESQAGVMSPAIYQSLQDVSSQVSTILGASVAVNDLPADPTQSDIETAWKTATGQTELVNGAKVLDVTNNKVWTYYSNNNAWVSLTAGVVITPVDIANATQPGIVKSASRAGMVMVETNGDMSVNGYDDLVAKDATLQGSVDSLQTQQTTTTNNVADLTTKVTKNTSDLANLQTEMATYSEQIATNQNNIATNTSEIATNKASIATLRTDTNKNTVDISTNASNIGSLQNSIDDLEGDLNTLSGKVTANTNSITTLGSNKQDTLVSGTNIKTVNNVSLLGSGNVAVQPTLVSGTNIKTINNTTILGSGNISLATPTDIADLRTEFVTAIGTANTRLATLIDGAGV